MLSRTTRFAAFVTIVAAGLMLTSPDRASAASSRFACGDDGLHTCCVDGGSTCPNGAFCCAFENRDVLFCGCTNAT